LLPRRRWRPQQAKEGVNEQRRITRHFFAKAGPEWDWSIALANVHDLGDTVVVEGRYKSVYKPTGKALDAQTCHVWKLENGTVKSFHQYADTAQIQKVMTPS
jgi:uncharacterized protein